MFTAEVGVSPVAGGMGAAYRARIAEIVREGRSFVRIDGEDVVFKAEVGAVAADVCQVQGVWVGHRLPGPGSFGGRDGRGDHAGPGVAGADRVPVRQLVQHRSPQVLPARSGSRSTAPSRPSCSDLDRSAPAASYSTPSLRFGTGCGHGTRRLLAAGVRTAEAWCSTATTSRRASRSGRRASSSCSWYCIVDGRCRGPSWWMRCGAMRLRTMPIETSRHCCPDSARCSAPRACRSARSRRFSCRTTHAWISSTPSTRSSRRRQP